MRIVLVRWRQIDRWRWAAQALPTTSPASGSSRSLVNMQIHDCERPRSSAALARTPLSACGGVFEPAATWDTEHDVGASWLPLLARARGGVLFLVRPLRDLAVQFSYRYVPVNSVLELQIISVTSLILQNKPGCVRRAERSHKCLPSGTSHFFRGLEVFCLTHCSRISVRTKSIGLSTLTSSSPGRSLALLITLSSTVRNVSAAISAHAR